MKIKIISFFILSIVLLVTGCNGQENTEQENQNLTIYTTIYPLEDFANRIGGDLVDVKSVYPPNTDAHTFEPTPRTMTEIADADAFIYTGVGLEGFVDAAIKTLSNEHVQLIEAGSGIELSGTGDNHGHESEDAHGENEEHHAEHDTDPHIWIDPVLSISLAENIKEALVELKPESKEVFEENYAALKEELMALDNEFTTAVTNSSNPEILVSHAAYGYWERRYGIEQISVAGLSPSQEPSQKQLQHIIETAKEHDINYVIFEQNVTGKVAEVVQKEIGAEALTLHNLESLTDEDINNNEDYFSLMRRNLEVLKKAME
jgi:zinc transport system substrate-binding protein